MTIFVARRAGDGQRRRFADVPLMVSVGDGFERVRWADGTPRTVRIDLGPAPE